MMNMALGTFYAMSVFMLPLEKEFGWTRTQTSWVTTIGMVMIASWYVIAGYIHDRRGPLSAGGALPVHHPDALPGPPARSAPGPGWHAAALLPPPQPVG